MYKVWKYAKTPLIIGIILVLMFFSYHWAKEIVFPKDRHISQNPCVEISTGPELLPKQVLVHVYNSGNRTGLAGRQAAALKEKGFNIGNIKNTAREAQNILIIGNAVENLEVKLVASYFKEPKIIADDRIDHSVDVILGNKYAGLSEKPLSGIPNPAGKLCLPTEVAPKPKSSGTANATATPTPTKTG